VRIRVRLPRPARSGKAEILALPVANEAGVPIRLGEIGSVVEEPVEPTILRKDLERIVYVFAEMAGRAPADAILSVQGDLAEAAPPPGVTYGWTGEGEWQITVDVFRDLGLAFAAALGLIYVLLLLQLRSASLPLVVMASIPLTMIGIFPGFAALNLFADLDVGGFGDPVFFTATAMIGMIALSGIVVRNAIILVEFVHEERARGGSLREALVSGGAVRLRPVLMTAGTTLLGAWPITLDPIFSGLAWALIFGLVASTIFTLVIIPVAYWKLQGHRTSSA
jgi:multidrug efflux pump subunit AcrB